MDRKLFLQHLTNSPQVQKVIEQNYNIGNYLPTGQRKPEPSPAGKVQIHQAAAMELAAKYGAHRARNEIEPGNQTHLEGMRETGARLQQTMRTLDDLSDAGHIHPKDHAEFTQNVHDAISASGDMIRIGRKGGLRESSGPTQITNKRQKLNTFLNANDPRRYASTDNQGVLRGPESFGTQGDRARAAIRDNQQTITRALETDPDRYRGMSPDQVEAEFYGSDQYMTVPPRRRNQRTVPATLMNGLREAKEGDLSKYLSRAISREYNIPSSQMPNAAKHPTLGKFINAVYERHGNSILAKHDRLRGEDEEAGDVSAERHQAAKEKFADFVKDTHSAYHKVGKK